MCSVAGRKTLGRIVHSTSRCIYENLAYEEHLLRTHDPEREGELMMMWSNRPAVVFGRHQNPWAEVALDEAARRHVAVARRHSGGGTVYHDEGNLNISLLTSQKAHCRKRNLEMIARAINGRFAVKVVPTSRDDLEMQPGSRKCSGTAARIVRGRAYHHMTMLVDVDLARLSGILRSDLQTRVRSTATRSVRAPAVGYLRQDDARGASVDALAACLADAWREGFEKVDETRVDVGEATRTVEGVRKAIDELRDWEWIYGRTPAFEFETRGGELIKIRNGRVAEARDQSIVGERFTRELIAVL
uniref:BPL/LPL catalytic domain-containing protein n=1 Tax=Pristionchus pacificus TaxID=54126 RepID=A0A8R1V2D9_PRIPA